MNQDEEARRAKAKRLRGQIRGIVGQGKAKPSTEVDRPECEAEEARPGQYRDKESPRDFIHRRMRELADSEKKS